MTGPVAVAGLGQPGTVQEDVVQQLRQPAPEASRPGSHISITCQSPRVGTSERTRPVGAGGRNRSRTCDLFLVMEALVPTELCALRGSLADSICIREASPEARYAGG